MTAEDHPLLSIACMVFAKDAGLTSVLAQGDWWHIVLSTILTCLLPDIDHPESFLGQRLKWVSKPIARAFGHRDFTHVLPAVFALLTTFYLKVPKSWLIPADTLQDMTLGCLNRILADMSIPVDVPLLRPCRWRFHLPILVFQKGNQLERFTCTVLFVWSVWMPHSLPENSTVHWPSQMANVLQVQLHWLVKHQVEYQKGKNRLSGINNSI